MRKEQISDSLNVLDDAILEETDRIRNRVAKSWEDSESGWEDKHREGSEGIRKEKSCEDSEGEDTRKEKKQKVSGNGRKENARNQREKVEKWWKWGAAAAGLLLAVCGGWILANQTWNQTDRDSSLHASRNSEENRESGTLDAGGTAELPMLAVAQAGQGEAGSYEGVRVYDISELVSANPWREEMVISALPVYENVLSYDENYIARGGDFEKMREFLLEVASSLGLDGESLTITDDVPDEETKQIITEKLQSVGETVPEGYFDPTKLIGEADGLKIEVDQAMTARVSFEPAISLPKEYHFTHYATYEELAETAGYLEKEYADFIGMEHPTVDIYGGGYNIYLQQGYNLAFYDRTEDVIQSIINFNFNRVTFYCDDQGKLFLARNYRPDLSRMVGEYPVITAAEARELLLQGNYITTVPYEMPGEEFIGKVELVYRTGEREQYYMPYYRFYVELPEAAMDDGLKAYGAYYVPAVESAYISDMPVWDGSFNG